MTSLLLLPGFACSQTCLTTHPPWHLGCWVHIQQSCDYSKLFSACGVQKEALPCTPCLKNQGGLQVCPVLPQTETSDPPLPTPFIQQPQG